jgi:hypothetical protein
MSSIYTPEYQWYAGGIGWRTDWVLKRFDGQILAWVFYNGQESLLFGWEVWGKRIYGACRTEEAALRKCEKLLKATLGKQTLNHNRKLMPYTPV